MTLAAFVYRDLRDPAPLPEHLAALATAGVAVTEAEDLFAPGRAAALTFDEGAPAALEGAAQLLAAARLPAAFFFTPRRLGREGYASAELVRALAAAGMTVGARAAEGRPWAGLSGGEYDREMRAPREALEDLLGRPVFLASARGPLGGEARAAASRAGYRYLYTERPALITAASDPMALPRLVVWRGAAPGALAALARGALLPHLALRGREALARAAGGLNGGRGLRLLSAEPGGAPGWAR